MFLEKYVCVFRALLLIVLTPVFAHGLYSPSTSLILLFVSLIRWR